MRCATSKRSRSKFIVRLRAVRDVIRLLATGDEKIRRLEAEELVDASVVEKLERQRRF